MLGLKLNHVSKRGLRNSARLLPTHGRTSDKCKPKDDKLRLEKYIWKCRRQNHGNLFWLECVGWTEITISLVSTIPYFLVLQWEHWIIEKSTYLFVPFSHVFLQEHHCTEYNCLHDDIIKWKHFPRYMPLVRGIQRFPVNSPHKSQWRGALMFSLICARMNGWVNNVEAGDLRRHRVHYDVIVMSSVPKLKISLCISVPVIKSYDLSFKSHWL